MVGKCRIALDGIQVCAVSSNGLNIFVAGKGYFEVRAGYDRYNKRVCSIWILVVCLPFCTGRRWNDSVKILFSVADV